MLEHYQFAHPGWLYLLPFILLLLVLRRRRGSEGSVVHSSVHFISVLSRNPNSLAGRIGDVLIVIAAVIMTLALARPQYIENKNFKMVKGIDIMVAFDLSTSMNTPDMFIGGRQTTRLQASKVIVNRFVESRPTDRIGLVGFAAKTKAFSPLTLDHAIVKQFVADFNDRTINADGTAIGSAIAAAASRLEERKETKAKVIVLVTDGASNSGQLSPLEAAEKAAQLGIKIYTIALGTDSPSGPGRSVVSYGEFDEATLKEIARITGGEHFRAENIAQFAQAFESINRLEQTEVKTHSFQTIIEYFMYFVGAATILTALGLLLKVLRPTPAP